MDHCFGFKITDASKVEVRDDEVLHLPRVKMMNHLHGLDLADLALAGLAMAR